MFAYIKGIIQEKDAMSGVLTRLVLDCHGFGMDIQISQHTAAMLPEIGQEAQIYTVFTIKETECLIFGFASPDEKELFILLTSVSGIGPKLALGLLGTLSSNQLSEAILEENDKLITQAPGVGAKVARRIILELKNKIEDWQNKNAVEMKYSISPAAKKEFTIDNEARGVLESLGYSPSEINHALSTIKKQNKEIDTESLVRESLRLLGSSNMAPVKPNNERIV